MTAPTTSRSITSTTRGCSNRRTGASNVDHQHTAIKFALVQLPGSLSSVTFVIKCYKRKATESAITILRKKYIHHLAVAVEVVLQIDIPSPKVKVAHIHFLSFQLCPTTVTRSGA
jgi:hypothetical protein